MTRFLLALLFSLAAINAMAASGYRIVHPDGSVEYTDEPKKGAEKVPLPEVQTYKPIPLKKKSSATTKKPADAQEKVKAQHVAYTALQITQPKAESTHHRNTGPLNVSVSASPQLQEGDSIVLYFDGKVFAKNRSGSFSIKLPDRGAHTLQAAIEDKDGNEQIQSKAITVYVRQPYIRNKPKKAP